MSKKWTQKNVSDFRQEYRNLVDEYGFDHKFKIVSNSRIVIFLIEQLVKWEMISFIVNIVDVEKSESPGFYARDRGYD